MTARDALARIPDAVRVAEQHARAERRAPVTAVSRPHVHRDVTRGSRDEGPQGPERRQVDTAYGGVPRARRVPGCTGIQEGRAVGPLPGAVPLSVPACFQVIEPGLCLHGRAARVQLSRRKGYRKPENTVVVARPSRWGNPYPVERFGRGLAVEGYRIAFVEGRLVRIKIDDVRVELAGKNLACWCPLDEPCHADVLLKIVNGGADV